MECLQVSVAPSKDVYDKVRGQVDMEALRQDGLLFHVAGELESGEVRIVDVWSDADGLERGRARMMATFAGAGVEQVVEEGPQPEISQAFDLVR